jgi:hypothetical protein
MIYPLSRSFEPKPPDSLIQKHLQVFGPKAVVHLHVTFDHVPHRLDVRSGLVLARPVAFLLLVDHSVLVIQF